MRHIAEGWAQILEDFPPSGKSRWYWESRSDYMGMFVTRDGAAKSARKAGYRILPDDDPDLASPCPERLCDGLLEPVPGGEKAACPVCGVIPEPPI